jgi:hypothetical protein
MKLKKDYNKHVINYSKDDFLNPKISSIHLINFLKKNKAISKGKGICIDLGSGPGSGTFFIAKQYPKINFKGIDYNKELINWSKRFWRSSDGKNFRLQNLSIEHGDWNYPKEIIKNLKGEKIQAVFSIHSLCTQKNFEVATKKIIDLNPDKIIFNSLFYDGPLDVLIHINDRNSNLDIDNPDADFNIHSLPSAKDFLIENGYKNIIIEKFDIGQKIEKPKNGERGTYTIKSEFGKFTQFSGPVYLPWYFLLASKE